MLSEIYIRDFAIIDQLRMQFASGFTVLTGETGAGKSIILDALMLLLGDRADTTLIRSGCETAYVEGVFRLPPQYRQALAPILEEEGLDGDEDDLLLLARELRLNGRNYCRINGRTVTLTLLREVSENLVDIHGQGEHLSLLKPKAHLPLLDAYAGLVPERKALAAEVRQLRKVRAELRDLRANARSIAQRVDMLQFQIEEIDIANLAVGEEEELRAERSRLANVEQLLRHTNEAMLLLLGVDDEMPAAIDLLSEAERAIGALARLDETKAPWLARLEGLVAEFDALVAELRDYQEDLEFNPGRLDFVEERLDLINRLKRKYGDDVEAVLARRDEAAAELDQIEHSEERMEEMAEEEDRFLHKIGEMGQALSEKRQAAATRLAAAVERQLADLRMEGGEFAVDFQRETDETGVYVDDERVAFDHTGIDRAEFLITTNPGEPLKPMAKVASGGETSRLMLALKTALAQVDETPTLIFDEIDQGIGGRVGDIVGRKLWGLTAHGGHQVIVVTHLPQLAGYGDSHFHVSKQLVNGRTKTMVDLLDVPGRVDELSAMLGTQDESARHGAHSILKRVSQVKNGD